MDKAKKDPSGRGAQGGGNVTVVQLSTAGPTTNEVPRVVVDPPPQLLDGTNSSSGGRHLLDWKSFEKKFSSQPYELASASSC